MINLLEQIKSIETSLKKEGFQLGISYDKNSLWIYDQEINRIEADNGRGGLKSNSTLYLYLLMKNQEITSMENLNYIEKTIKLKEVLDECGTPYEIVNLKENKELLEQRAEKIKNILSRLQ